MLNRRTLLAAGAGALAGCASTPAAPDPATDAQFRDLVDRLAQRPRRARAFLLRTFNPARLTGEGRVLYEALLPGAEADEALARRNWGSNGLPYAVTHRYGAFRHAVEMREDEDPDRRAVQIHDDTNRMLGDAERGVIAPDFLLDVTIAAVDATASRVRTEGDRYEAVGDALARQLEVLRELRSRAPAEAGVWQFPGGDEFYAQTLQFHYGAPVEASAAHELALERCRELRSEADAMMRSLGSTRGTVAERLRELMGDPRYRYAQNDSGKASALDDMRSALERVRTLVAPAIEGVEDAPAEVRRLPASREANGGAGARSGSIYYVDLGAPRPRWTLPSVVHHELIPGHILQRTVRDSRLGAGAAAAIRGQLQRGLGDLCRAAGRRAGRSQTIHWRALATCNGCCSAWPASWPTLAFTRCAGRASVRFTRCAPCRARASPSSASRTMSFGSAPNPARMLRKVWQPCTWRSCGRAQNERQAPFST